MQSEFRKMVSFVLAATLFLESCSSSTLIQSIPSGAKIYLDGEPVGTTPYRHRDTKITGSTSTVRLELEGYESLHTAFSRDEEVDAGAIVGGVFLLVPFLWTMKYKPTHTYELSPLLPIEKHSPLNKQDSGMSGTKAARLRELKQLLDEKILSPEEYQKEKRKILDEKGQ